MPLPADFLRTDAPLRLLAIKAAADHASLAHKGQFRKDKKTPYIIHPARVAGLVGIFNGSHDAIIAAWLHDVYEDCTPEWILKTDDLIKSLPLPAVERQEIADIIDALTKKNTIANKADRLSDSLRRIAEAPAEATLVKLCDRIDNLLDSADRDGRFTKRYLASTDEVIAVLSGPASRYGYDMALAVLVEIRNTKMKLL